MDVPTGHCDMCDLPLAYCEHGRPAPTPAPAPAERAGPARRPSGSSPRPATRKPTTPKPTTRGTTVKARSVGRRWTPPEELSPVILEILREADHALDGEEVFEELEARVGDRLRPGDRERTPEGELRWQYAARRARQALITEGLVARGRPGKWVLVEGGA